MRYRGNTGATLRCMLSKYRQSLEYGLVARYCLLKKLQRTYTILSTLARTTATSRSLQLAVEEQSPKIVLCKPSQRGVAGCQRAKTI
jgi:hypothetical protein